MPALSKERIATLIAPFLPNTEVPAGLYSQLSLYLDVLLRWNGRTNLTAIREPEEIVVRHFGESLFAGVHVSAAKPAIFWISARERAFRAFRFSSFTQVSASRWRSLRARRRRSSAKLYVFWA